VGTCTVAASGTYQLELTDAVLEASQTGATVRFTLNDQGIAETAVLRPGTMQALALNVSQPASTGQRIASAPAAASVPVVVATPAAQRIASAPSTSSPATATPASTPSVPAAAAPVAAAAPTLPSPVTQVAGVNSGPTAQQPARLPSAPSTTHPAAVTTPSTVVAAQNAPIARAGAAIASTPVASAPVAQRTAGSTPTQLPSTGVGLRVDTSPTLMMVLTTLLVTVTGLGSALAATHWRRATARQEEQ
jgi:hypothetical protein